MIVPWTEIPEATLVNLIEEFVSREGTDYGHSDVSLEKKVQHVKSQLKSGIAVVVFDHESETCNLVKREDVREYTER